MASKIKLLTSLALLLIAGISIGGQNQGPRRWKVMVIVPEKHLTRPRIPDPAAETAICKGLIDAGYKVIDQDRVRELISGEIEDRIFQGGKNADIETRRIARKVGADIVISGEAFSTLVSSSSVNTDLGQVTKFICEARVELKATRMDTSEKFFADAVHKVGAPDLSEELSSKQCLSEAGDTIVPKILEKLATLSTSAKAFVTVEIRNVTFSQGSTLREALRKTDGVLDVDQGDFEARTWTMEITVLNTKLPRISFNLESNTSLKKQHLTIQNASKSMITLVKS